LRCVPRSRSGIEIPAGTFFLYIYPEEMLAVASSLLGALLRKLALARGRARETNAHT